MATLKQIAADLGVSHGLVSRVLSNRMGNTGVSEKTRLTILRRAKELNYRPNPNASALKRGLRGSIGVFLHKIGTQGTELNLTFVDKVATCLSDRGLNLLVRVFEEDEEFLSACNPALFRRIDGLIVAGLWHHSLALKLNQLEADGLHIVTACHGASSHSSIPNFEVDQEKQGCLATRHLIEVGCSNIAHINNHELRYLGYLHAHKEAGRVPDPRLNIPTGDFTRQSGYGAMEKLHMLGMPFDGLVAQSDAQAAGAMYYLLEQGRPRETWPKITGVDDSPIATDYCAIPLTSVTAEMKTSAEMAVAAIVSKIEGGTATSCLIPPRLVIRESTVPGTRA